MRDEPDQLDEAADPEWFRGPTRREHWIGAALFVGFGAFFVALFFVQQTWWFRWVTLALAAFSLFRGLRHAHFALKTTP